MSATLDEEKVKNWFQSQTREIAPPATSDALASILARRALSSSAERPVRQRALAAKPIPIPPAELVDWVGGGDVHMFQTVGLLNTWQLHVYCGLRPTDRVLEPGCGCGRNARYLAPYLEPSRGGYDGFDIHRDSIDWATEHVTSAYPNVRFAFADIRNTNYNPDGPVPDGGYEFPYASASFDVVFLPSVFTHLTRDGFEQYAREIARVLAPGGRLLSWHFLLDPITRELATTGKSALPLQVYDDVSWAMEPENPCAAIAFDEAYVLETFELVGLHAQLVLHGTWSGRVPDGLVDAQDRVLAVKAQST